MIRQSATVYPASVVQDDRWEPYRCAANRRIVDINHVRSQVRYSCDRCRTTHTVEVGVRYTSENESA